MTVSELKEAWIYHHMMTNIRVFNENHKRFENEKEYQGKRVKSFDAYVDSNGIANLNVTVFES